MTSPEKHDLIVVGAGPAGLSAAITAESERIDTLVLDCSERLGGQAGTSSLIQNYPGFPQGISGADLAARMVDQALTFTTEFIAPVTVQEIEAVEGGVSVTTGERSTYLGQAVLLSTGVDYRYLRARNLAAYLGRGAKYGSPDTSLQYPDKDIFVVGGANSAGQAAVHLSEFDGSRVHILVRGKSIEDKMSGYLVDKIMDRSNIEVHTETELVGVDGNGHLEKVTLQTNEGNSEMPADEVFVLIGSVPKTAWLPPSVALDDQGFVMAGSDIPKDIQDQFEDTSGGRQPLPHETSIPGLFVAGDVRCGTHKRVALACGDGAGVVPELHRLRQLQYE